MRKAVIEVGFYTVKEGPTGGWFVLYTLNDRTISVHSDKESAIEHARHYERTDQEAINRAYAYRPA